jgi:hypothetical protein
MRSWAGDTDQLRVYYRSSSTGDWTQIAEYTDAVSSWTTEDGIVLPNLSSTYQIAFEFIDKYGYGLGIDDVKIVQGASCPKPTDLEVTTSITNDAKTATATWEGTADNYNIDINGTVTNNVTSPYTFNVEIATTYTVKVQASCGEGETSDWSNPLSFTTPDCIGGHVIEYTLNDSYGDGWNGASITVVEGCGNLVETLTLNSGSSNSGTLTLCGDYYELIWNTGNYDTECSFTFTENGTTLFTKPSNVSDGLVLYTIGTTFAKPTGLTAGTPDTHEVALTWTPGDSETAWQLCLNNDESTVIDINNTNSTINEGSVSYTLTGLTADTEYSVMVRAYIDETTQSCWSNPVTFTTAEACHKPTNLAETNITTNSATLSWEGTSDSYVLQYRTAAQDINMTMWHQIGEDETATATLDTYTYDLSDYIGSGYVAIRHYNVTNMFRLAIDDIVITDGNGEELFSEDFESGSIPSTLTNQDVDGDGYNWAAIAFDSQVGNGDYVAVSDSWNSNAGPLTPDNWLIIPVSELGGTLTFLARGVDASFPAEVFGVFVTTASLTDALSPVAAGNWSDGITTEEESYQLTDLTANTPYEWQVKGICGTDDESSWTTSTFKTIELGTKNFVTEGNWNVADNWFPAGVPTINDKVIISANATIPAGVVATAKKITLDNATLTIADGGQLKQNGNVEVIMKKEIASYGTGSANWHFIASPLTTTRLTYITDWSYVNALDGNYDLFGFDPTQALEWINYRSSSGHALFTSGSNNPVLVQQTGYLYANEEDMTLQFEGSTAVKSNGNVLSQELTFDDSSTNPFNGWVLVGNPFTCNGYVTYSGDATFYKMNAAGDGLEAYEDGVELAPGEGAFMKVSASGTITFSSEAPEGFTSTSTTDAETLPLLPLHGLATNQDANILELANEGIEDDELAQYVGGTTNVKLAGRTIVGNGTLNTICLPFDITIAGSPLDGATAYELTETDFTDHTLTLNFTTVDALVAGKPYFIKWASGGGVENPVFRNVTIGAVNATSTNFVETDQLYFQGTYQAVTFDENDTRKLYLGSDNNLYYPAAAGITVNAFRGFFLLNGIDAGDIASQAIVLGDGETTEIISIDNSQLAIDNDAWYTLQGQKIGKKPTTTGVYIHNGRKVIVK